MIPATWKCPDCSPAEQYVLKELQNTKITDRNALATILGNIKQESKFIPNICEGARVNYEDCHVGGYGLIQWTSIGRYDNLGKFCTKYGCDGGLEGQTRYMINEKSSNAICLSLKAEEGLSISTWFLPITG